MQPSNREVGVVLDKHSEITTANAAINDVISTIPGSEPKINAFLGHLRIIGEAMPTIDHTTVGDPETSVSSSEYTVGLNDQATEILIATLKTYANNRATEQLAAQNAKDMSKELQATLDISEQMQSKG